jgi:glycosyltransferase involved in cell wall biosynthesis
LQKLGCERVEVIYNAFDLGEFTFDPEEVDAFLARHGIPRDKPIIYIGNASRQKGVVEVYEALKDEGYTLVMTGRNKEVDLPALWFNLERRDYLRLLHACDVVITMSKLLEGWNRVAHEALLCRTPVIGSGIGGMRELLTEARQVILPDPAGLPEAVRSVLEQRALYEQRGYAFVEQLDTAYFARAWQTLTETLIEENTLANA